MRYFIFVLFLASTFVVKAQSKTTDELHKKNPETFSLFFYHNTLKMFNQSNDKDIDALIKDIEKMKFLMIDKTKFAVGDYKKLVNSYKNEAFEEIMTSRMDGRNLDVFLKEVNGKTKGMIVTVNDEKNLIVLDIVGSIALDKVSKLVTTLDQSSELGEKIKAFTKKNDK